MNLIRTVELLRLTLAGSLDRSSTDAVIDLCVQHTVKILRWSRNQYSPRVMQIGLTVEDLAYDIVADIVTGPDGQHCAPLQTALRKLPHGDEDELLGSFEALLFSNVTQSLTRIQAEINRTQFLLLRSLRRNVKVRSDLTSIDGLDGRWYMFQDPDTACLERDAIPVEELRQYIRGADLNGFPLAIGLLLEMLHFLQDQDTYRKAVRENDVILISMEIVGTKLLDVVELERTIPDPGSGIDNMFLAERTVLRAIDQIREEFEAYYSDTDGLSEEEIEIFTRAATAFFRDRIDGESGSHYSYLRDEMPGLTQARFRESYHNRFAYFIKKVTESLSISLQNEDYAVPD